MVESYKPKNEELEVLTKLTEEKTNKKAYEEY